MSNVTIRQQLTFKGITRKPCSFPPYKIYKESLMMLPGSPALGFSPILSK